MKRARDLFPKIISDENLREAIKAVCKSHRWVKYPQKPNRTVMWIERTFEARVEELRGLIINGFTASPAMPKRRYDKNAGKWRDIAEPLLWPDQCVHHALIQVIEPVLMRGMDHWCCGSIKGRGAHYGIRAIRKWMASKKTAWCIEMDIRHFYDSLKPEQIMMRMRSLIKDHRSLDLIWRVIKDGILIGAYTSQWFANTFLQPLDGLIRKTGASYYLRYMDNFTVFADRKRTACRIIQVTRKWLNAHDLELKDNWQKFKVRKKMPVTDDDKAKRKRRYPNALGYRFGRGFVLMRKKNLLRLERHLRRFYRLRTERKFIPVKFAQALLSRLGQMRHCNAAKLYARIYRPRTMKYLKDIVRDYYRRELAKWNTFLATNA